MDKNKLIAKAEAALQRAQDLQAAAEGAEEHDAEGQAAIDAAIAESEGLYQQAADAEAREARLAELEKRAKAPAGRIGADLAPHTDPKNTRNGRHQYDAMKALSEAYAQKRGEGSLTGIEAEVQAELRKLKPNSSGLILPFDAMVKTRALDTTTAAGALGQTIMTPIIDVLRSRLVLSKAGVRVIAADSPFKLPKASAATVSWGTQAPEISTPNIGSVAFTPHTVGARSTIERAVLKYSSVDAKGYTISQLMAVTSQAIQVAALHGTGDADEQPLGLFARTSSEVNVIDMGTNGGAPTRAKLLAMVAAAEEANAPEGTEAFITSPTVLGKLEATPLESGFPVYIYDSANQKVVNRPVYSTSSVRDDLTDGTSTGVCSAIAFGAWEEMIIALFGGGFEVLIDDVSGQNGSVTVTVVSDCDVQLAQGKAFSIATDVLTS